MKKTKKEADVTTPEDTLIMCDEALANISDQYRQARRAGDQTKARELWTQAKMFMSWRREAWQELTGRWPVSS